VGYKVILKLYLHFFSIPFCYNCKLYCWWSE